jgi:hypothetical protein
LGEKQVKSVKNSKNTEGATQINFGKKAKSSVEKKKENMSQNNALTPKG